TLDTLGLHWDDEVDYQSLHISEYEEALADLVTQHKVYRCECSRKNLSQVYAKTCRHTSISLQTPHALRLLVDDQHICFYDHLQGTIEQHVATRYGDFILKRKDAIIAYAFAVVLDDARQGITDVVRGLDLLDETPKQRYLQYCLNLPMLNYCHVPILVDQRGKKLSKTTLASAVDLSSPSNTLRQLLMWLNQHPPRELEHAPVVDVLAWAIACWDRTKLSGISSISLAL
ncbi:MAG: hypothetical protein RLZZ384_696, partial [Pseudomonadota bacterium]